MERKSGIAPVNATGKKERIDSLNFDLMNVTSDLKGLTNLIRMFYISNIQNSYCGPEKGSPEYYEMLDDIFSFVVSSLDNVTADLDAINTDIDLANMKTA